MKNKKLRTFIIILAVIWNIYCIFGILNNFSHYKIADWIIIIIFIITPYVVIAKLFKKESYNNSNKTENLLTNTTSINTTDPIKTDKISSEQISSQEHIISPTLPKPPKNAKKTLSQETTTKPQKYFNTNETETLRILDVLNQSDLIIHSTNNPDTLCSRYQLIYKNAFILKGFEQKNLYKTSSKADYYIDLCNKDICHILVKSCYKKYLQKAELELKTTNGIQKRINKFVEILKQYENKCPFMDLQTISKQIISNSTIANPSTKHEKNNKAIIRTDQQEISDAEIPDLIQASYKKTLEDQKNLSNQKFCRTSKEEELSFKFSQTYSSTIQEMEDAIYYNASLIGNTNNHWIKSATKNDLINKIQLCDNTIQAFEKCKKFCYRKGKGGTIYFQDTWEYCNNKNNQSFSYIDSILKLKDKLIEQLGTKED